MMKQEEKVHLSLVNRFGFLEKSSRIQRQRRIFADMPYENFRQVFEYAVKDLKFSILSAITGLDDGSTFGVVYHVASDAGISLSLKTGIPRDNPVLKTVTDIFPGAEIYEREMADLFGIKVEGLEKGKRYPLPDNWPDGQYPLRKDWKRDMLKEKETRKDA